MIEQTVDLWHIYDSRPFAICCITTNGFVKRNGKAVMGRGVAKQAMERFPDIAARLGEQLHHPAIGNRVQFIAPRLVAFPVKPAEGVSDGTNVVQHMARLFPAGAVVPGWAMKADLTIIEKSLDELQRYHDLCGWFDKVYLPRPGCGAGGLEWETVKPLCERLDDWLVVIERETDD